MSLVATGRQRWQGIPAPCGYMWAPAAEVSPPGKTCDHGDSTQPPVRGEGTGPREVDPGLHPPLKNQAEAPVVLSVHYPKGHCQLPGPGGAEGLAFRTSQSV